MRTALLVACKDLELVVRDWAALLFILLVPVVIIGISATSLGGSTGPRIVLPLVNLDEGPVAEVLIEVLSDDVIVEEVSLEEAHRRVLVEQSSATALVLPERLSKRYLAGDESTLTLLTDPAKGSEVGVVKAYLLLADRDAAALADPFHEELIAIEEQSLTGSELTTDNFEQTIPGFSTMFIFMSLIFGVAFGLDDERRWGTLVRLRMAPTSLVPILFGKVAARVVIGFAQAVLLFGFGRLAFGLALGPSVTTFALMLFAIVLGLTGLSMLAVPLMRTREQIIPLGLTAVLIACSIGGCWWPLFQEPIWLQRIAFVFPTAWGMNGLHDLILREKTLLEVLPTLAVLTAYGLGGITVGALLWVRREAASTRSD
jgi:ABC-2 type transport system permease protein